MPETIDSVKNALDSIYAKCNLHFENFSPEDESSAYYAHTFTIKGKQGLFRIAKKTPTKSGSFVTIWKRGPDGIILPYESSDAIDFTVIAVSNENDIGVFIFPKSLLIKKNIFSAHGTEGKRALRVYAPWDETTSAQATKTKKWQEHFFVNLNASDLDSTHKIIHCILGEVI